MRDGKLNGRYLLCPSICAGGIISSSCYYNATMIEKSSEERLRFSRKIFRAKSNSSGREEEWEQTIPLYRPMRVSTQRFVFHDNEGVYIYVEGNISLGIGTLNRNQSTKFAPSPLLCTVSSGSLGRKLTLDPFCQVHLSFEYRNSIMYNKVECAKKVSLSDVPWNNRVLHG